MVMGTVEERTSGTGHMHTWSPCILGHRLEFMVAAAAVLKPGVLWASPHFQGFSQSLEPEGPFLCSFVLVLILPDMTSLRGLL